MTGWTPPAEVALPPTALVDAFDDLPLWSAPFGMALLDAVDLHPTAIALDVGCGAGFPLVELAERLGPRAHVHGVDPWDAALDRVRGKLAARAVANVTLHRARAEALPLADRAVDLVVSNNGFNNVDDLDAALAECARVARPDAQLVYAYNLPASMRELYDALDAALAARGLEAARAAAWAHIDHKRQPVEATVAALARAGFATTRVDEHGFRWRFADAAAMFQHWFMRLAFVPSWIEVVPAAERAAVFTAVSAALDQPGGVTLTIPFACVVARRH
ncbi:MAG: class I SAM-dependent methyltransferase [Myxococcales bacterium]|nr:class I SAM-dependent methyltransferase [Myxococcales bacterium]MBP6849517.1 class I SAM-dependent methyltransferase [Kofleriaceae bacterium]